MASGGVVAGAASEDEGALGEILRSWGQSEVDEWITNRDRAAARGGAGEWAASRERVELTGPQIEVFRATERFQVLVAGRRFGKTHLAVAKIRHAALSKPNQIIWYIAPTYKQARKDFWRPFTKAMKPYIVELNKTTMTVELVNGALISLHGGETYDSLRGSGLDGVVFDEAADIPLEAWTEGVRPMLSDKLGWALFIGTPKGFNHLHQWWVDGQSGKPGWRSWLYTTLDGGNVPREEVEAARRDLDPRTFKQEYEASFENMGAGRVYYAFERAHNVTHTVFDPSLPLAWSLDFNIEPMCSVIGQATNRDMWVLQEIIIPVASTYDVCKRFAEVAERYRQMMRRQPWEPQRLVVEVYGDATGQNRQHAGVTDWRIVKDWAASVSDKFDVRFRLATHNPEVKDRAASVNAVLCNAAGERRCWIAPECTWLIRDMEQVLWKQDGHGNTLSQLDNSNKQLTHVSDAFGYWVSGAFPLRVVGGERRGLLV